MKISPRLRQIDQMISRPYSHIWDCCCDHGLLGMHLLQRQTADTVHFVDIVEALMRDVEDKLHRYFPKTPEDDRWQVHCRDVATLPLAFTKPENKPQLVIIAGVGGDLLIELVNGILKINPGLSLEFLLCPVRQNYKVREAMTDSGLSLLNEQLVRDNNRFYEVLHLSTNSGQPISPVGSMMWSLEHPDHQEYLQQILTHYQRMQNSANQEVEQIIAAYRTLLSAAP